MTDPEIEVAVTQADREASAVRRLKAQCEYAADWLAKCLEEVEAFSKEPDCLQGFTENWTKSAGRAYEKLTYLSALVDIVRDRDEWRAQHENLLSVRKADVEVAEQRGRAEGAAQERAEIVDWLRENAPQYSHEQLADAIERGEYKRSE